MIRLRLHSIIWPVLALVVSLSTPSMAQDAPAMPGMPDSRAAEQIELFPTREASGTAWVPAQTPMSGAHWRLGTWEVMADGVVFAQ